MDLAAKKYFIALTAEVDKLELINWLMFNSFNSLKTKVDDLDLGKLITI